MSGIEGAAGVLDFWFGTPGEPPAISPRREWFVKSPGFDRLIAERFGALIEAALAGRIDHWGAGARAALARILLLDQFTRNAFRGTARAFSGDARALEEALRLLERGAERQLAPLERMFVYLPLEHAEELALQERSVALFDALAVENPTLEDSAAYARRHRDVIRRFGRFPHRNAALGRESSAAERAYLALPGAGF